MAKQTILVGTSANDGTGDTLRAAAIKVNSNFSEVYDTAQGAFDKANAGIALHTSELLANAQFIAAVNSSQNTTIGIIFAAANDAWTQANTGTGIATAGFLAANNGWSAANTAQGTATAGFLAANAAQGTATSGFLAANAAQGTATSGFLAANVAQGTATSGFLTANVAQGTADAGFLAANTAQGTATSSFNRANNTLLLVSIPTSSTGQAGDKENSVSANAKYLYYCTTDYVQAQGFDPQPDIWKRIEWSADTW